MEVNLSKIGPNNGGCSRSCPYHQGSVCEVTGDIVHIDTHGSTPCPPFRDLKGTAYKRMQSEEDEKHRKLQGLVKRVAVQKKTIEDTERGLARQTESTELSLKHLREDLARYQEALKEAQGADG